MPAGIRSRQIATLLGVNLHVLEAERPQAVNEVLLEFMRRGAAER